MTRKNLILIVFSFIAIVVWIGYNVYSNISTSTYDENQAQQQVDKYVQDVGTDMQLGTLSKVNALAGNIKVNNSTLSSTNQ